MTGAVWSIWLGSAYALARHGWADWRKGRDDPDERQAILITAGAFALIYAVAAMAIWALT